MKWRDGPMTTWPNLCEDPRELGLSHRISREHRTRVVHAEMPHEHFGKHIAEVGGHGQIARVVALVRRQPGPPAVNLPAAHVAADDEHGVAMAMVGAAIAVLGDRAA